MKFFSPSLKSTAGKPPLTLVSGMPRSGTSMMMRMLAEGGLPPLTDEVRGADEDNPNGYFELEVVRQLKVGNFAWLEEADAKAVKVISGLLEYLPHEYEYKIVFMERDPKETLASQKRMLDHRGQESRLSDEEMEHQLQLHLSAIKPWLVRQPNMEVLYINYNALLTEPTACCESLREFLGSSIDPKQMLAVPDQHLYRNRAAAEE